MLKEFKEFAVKGNALDLAVGIVIGAAFTQVVNSLVYDILTPFLSFFTGSVNFGNLNLTIFGHAFRYGSFLNALINFLIVSFAVFLLVKQINRFRKQKEPFEKPCPFCLSNVPINAVKCAHCTSQLT